VSSCEIFGELLIFKVVKTITDPVKPCMSI
jgi:hypothetical protein